MSDKRAELTWHACGVASGAYADLVTSIAPEPAADTTSAAESAELPPRLFLYDGVCGLCDRSVKLLLRIDREREAFHYAPLQGETAALLRQRHRDIPTELDSVVFVDAGRVWLRSRAFVRAARYMPMPWRLLRALAIIPWPLADLVYRAVARVRYRVFGRFDSCQLPDPAERARFLP